MPSFTRALGSVALVGALFFGAVGCGGSSSSSASFCKAAKSDNLDNIDPADGKKFINALKSLQAKAPAAIKSDMDYFVNAMVAVQDAGKDPAKAADALKSIDQDRVQKASDNIQKYLKDECGIKTA